MPAPERDNLYRIGAVARMTGVAVERLRAWERRHGLAPAHRVGRTRFYSAEQIERLKDIKALIDQGHPISTLADLDADQLAERRRERRPVPADAGAATVGLIGPNLLVLEQQAGGDSTISVTSRWANLERFKGDQAGHRPVDVIVAQLPVVGAQVIQAITRIQPNAQVIVVYQFATAQQLDALDDLDIPAVAWPVSWKEIEQLCEHRAPLPLRAARTAPRRFSDEQLIAIAAELAPGDTARYLVELVTQLNAFAEFNLQAAMEQGDADDLHERTHSAAAAARAQLELALEAWL